VDIEEGRDEPVQRVASQTLPWLASASATPISAVAGGSVVTQLARVARRGQCRSTFAPFRFVTSERAVVNAQTLETDE